MREVCQIFTLRLLSVWLFTSLIGLTFTAEAIGMVRLAPNGSPRLIVPVHDSIKPDLLLQSSGWSRMVDAGELRAEKPRPRPQPNRLAFEQYYAGFPVIGGRLVITTDGDGYVAMAHSSLATWLAQSTPDFFISSETAITNARKESHPQYFVTEPMVDQVVLPRNGIPNFCYRVKVTLSRPTRAMEYFFKASDGTLLLAEDRLKHFDGRGLVFDPDPKSALLDDNLSDNDDDSAAIPPEAYSEVTLPDLSFDEDSLLILTGPLADTSPTENRYRSESGQFLFDRSDDHFEEVMAYYHIDRQARYFSILEYPIFDPQLIDVNRIGEDASFFNPQTGIITTGTGGVDDAEDADVLIHEFTHALIEYEQPDWRGGETGLLVEGLCDYFAGDYSLFIAPEFEPMDIYNWDGHNQFWDGRILNSEYHYPEDCQGDIHDAGQIWSSLLTEIRLTADRDLWNLIVLGSHFILADSATVHDAVWSLLIEDEFETDGVFRGAVVAAAESRGIISPGEFAPIITHTSPHDSENENEATEISVIIQSDWWNGIDSDNVWCIYHFEGEEPESLLLVRTPDGFENSYHAVIPAPHRETEVSYYIYAADRGGLFSIDPPDAPELQHHFYIGPDRTPPVIVDQDRLPDTVFPTGQIQFSAIVRDNIAVSEVWLIWYDDEMSVLGETELSPSDESPELFIGTIRWRADRDQSIFYRVRATDASENQNEFQSALRTFTVRSEAMVDDFERSNQTWDLTGWVRTSTDSYSGEWSIIDRPPREQVAQSESTAEIREFWRFSGMLHARLRFAERHFFERAVSEYGIIEVLEEGSNVWHEVFRISAFQQDWIEREVDLDRWASRNSPPIKLRFRTITSDGARPFQGWKIDDLRLRVGNIVSAEKEYEIPVGLQVGLPYPNPSNGFVNFRFISSESVNISVFDLSGRTVATTQIPAGQGISTIDLKTLPTGIYWLGLNSSTPPKRQFLLLK